jgi:hypothetical protein
MKKIIIILLVTTSALVTNAKAAARTTAASYNLSAQKTAVVLNSKTNLNKIEPGVTYFVYQSNGYLMLLAMYDNGYSTITCIGYASYNP